MRKPVHCRPQAYDLFASQLPLIESSSGLLRVAVAIAMHEMHDASAHAAEAMIDSYASVVRSRVRSNNSQARLAHLHEVLFEEAGFTGNSDDFYNPRNSYLPAILSTRRGLPITLSLIYKLVADRVGLNVIGVNAPLHFMAAVQSGDKTLLIDPFFAGRALSRDEAFERMEQACGRTIARVDELLPKATHRQWIARILENLRQIFAHTGHLPNLAAMTELRGLLLTEG